MNRCPGCRSVVAPTAARCPLCGVVIVQENSAAQPITPAPNPEPKTPVDGQASPQASPDPAAAAHEVPSLGPSPQMAPLQPINPNPAPGPDRTLGIVYGTPDYTGASPVSPFDPMIPLPASLQGNAPAPTVSGAAPAPTGSQTSLPDASMPPGFTGYEPTARGTLDPKVTRLAQFGCMGFLCLMLLGLVLSPKMNRALGILGATPPPRLTPPPGIAPLLPPAEARNSPRRGTARSENERTVPTSPPAEVSAYVNWLRNFQQQRQSRNDYYLQNIGTMLSQIGGARGQADPLTILNQVRYAMPSQAPTPPLSTAINGVTEWVKFARQDVEALDKTQPPAACAELHKEYRAVCDWTANYLAQGADRIQGFQNAMTTGDPRSREQAWTERASSATNDISDVRNRSNELRSLTQRIPNELATLRRAYPSVPGGLWLRVDW